MGALEILFIMYARACAHTHTVHTDRSEGQCCSEILQEEKCLEFAFEGRESSKVPDVLGNGRSVRCTSFLSYTDLLPVD